MANAVLATPEAPFESRGLDKKLTLWERLRKGDEVAHLITLAGGWSILIITALLVQHLWVFSRLSRHAFGWHFLVDSTWDPSMDILAHGLSSTARLSLPCWH